MNSILKKAAALTMSAMVAAMTAIPAFAEEIPEPDENGVYGQAGIAWMIMDWWDYRRATSEQALDEYGTNEVSSTYHDVNITGNGSYTVDMSGYNCLDWSGQQYNCGYLGLYLELPLIPAPEECEDGEQPTMVVTLDDVTIDGVTYTFLEQPQPEDSENVGKILKIKNGYGEPAKTDPPMDNAAWTTSDPITINFTITGLPTDKIEDYADETVEKISGYGSLANDPAMAEELGAETEAAEDAVEEESTEEADAETTEEASAADTSSAAEEKKVSTGAIVGICAACAAVIAAIIALVVKKK